MVEIEIIESKDEEGALLDATPSSEMPSTSDDVHDGVEPTMTKQDAMDPSCLNEHLYTRNKSCDSDERTSEMIATTKSFDETSIETAELSGADSDTTEENDKAADPSTTVTVEQENQPQNDEHASTPSVSSNVDGKDVCAKIAELLGDEPVPSIADLATHPKLKPLTINKKEFYKALELALDNAEKEKAESSKTNDEKTDTNVPVSDEGDLQWRFVVETMTVLLQANQDELIDDQFCSELHESISKSASVLEETMDELNQTEKDLEKSISCKLGIASTFDDGTHDKELVNDTDVIKDLKEDFAKLSSALDNESQRLASRLKEWSASLETTTITTRGHKEEKDSRSLTVQDLVLNELVNSDLDGHENIIEDDLHFCLQVFADLFNEDVDEVTESFKKDGQTFKGFVREMLSHVIAFLDSWNETCTNKDHADHGSLKVLLADETSHDLTLQETTPKQEASSDFNVSLRLDQQTTDSPSSALFVVPSSPGCSGNDEENIQSTICTTPPSSLSSRSLDGDRQQREALFQDMVVCIANFIQILKISTELTTLGDKISDEVEEKARREASETQAQTEESVVTSGVTTERVTGDIAENSTYDVAIAPFDEQDHGLLNVSTENLVQETVSAMEPDKDTTYECPTNVQKAETSDSTNLSINNLEKEGSTGTKSAEDTTEENLVKDIALVTEHGTGMAAEDPTTNLPEGTSPDEAVAFSGEMEEELASDVVSDQDTGEECMNKEIVCATEPADGTAPEGLTENLSKDATGNENITPIATSGEATAPFDELKEEETGKAEESLEEGTVTLFTEAVVPPSESSSTSATDNAISVPVAQSKHQATYDSSSSGSAAEKSLIQEIASAARSTIDTAVERLTDMAPKCTSDEATDAFLDEQEIPTTIDSSTSADVVEKSLVHESALSAMPANDETADTSDPSPCNGAGRETLVHGKTSLVDLDDGFDGADADCHHADNAATESAVGGTANVPHDELDAYEDTDSVALRDVNEKSVVQETTSFLDLDDDGAVACPTENASDASTVGASVIAPDDEMENPAVTEVIAREDIIESLVQETTLLVEPAEGLTNSAETTAGTVHSAKKESREASVDTSPTQDYSLCCNRQDVDFLESTLNEDFSKIGASLKEDFLAIKRLLEIEPGNKMKQETSDTTNKVTEGEDRHNETQVSSTGDSVTAHKASGGNVHDNPNNDNIVTKDEGPEGNADISCDVGRELDSNKEETFGMKVNTQEGCVSAVSEQPKAPNEAEIWDSSINETVTLRDPAGAKANDNLSTYNTVTNDEGPESNSGSIEDVGSDLNFKKDEPFGMKVDTQEGCVYDVSEQPKRINEADIVGLSMDETVTTRDPTGANACENPNTDNIVTNDEGPESNSGSIEDVGRDLNFKKVEPVGMKAPEQPKRIEEAEVVDSSMDKTVSPCDPAGANAFDKSGTNNFVTTQEAPESTSGSIEDVGHELDSKKDELFTMKADAQDGYVSDVSEQQKSPNEAENVELSMGEIVAARGSFDACNDSDDDDIDKFRHDFVLQDMIDECNSRDVLPSEISEPAKVPDGKVIVEPNIKHDEKSTCLPSTKSNTNIPNMNDSSDRVSAFVSHPSAPCDAPGVIFIASTDDSLELNCAKDEKGTEASNDDVTKTNRMKMGLPPKPEYYRPIRQVAPTKVKDGDECISSPDHNQTTMSLPPRPPASNSFPKEAMKSKSILDTVKGNASSVVSECETTVATSVDRETLDDSSDDSSLDSVEVDATCLMGDVVDAILVTVFGPYELTDESSLSSKDSGGECKKHRPPVTRVGRDKIVRTQRRKIRRTSDSQTNSDEKYPITGRPNSNEKRVRFVDVRKKRSSSRRKRKSAVARS